MKTNIRVDGESLRSRVVRSFNFPILALAGVLLLSAVMDGKAQQSGGNGAAANIFDAGTNSGVIEITFKPNNRPDSLAIYYPPRNKGGKVIYTTGQTVTDATVLNPLTGSFKGTSTFFEVVINEGLPSDPNNVWSYVGVAKDPAGNVILNITMNQTTSTTTAAPTPAPTPTPTPAPARTPIVRVVAGVTRVNLRAGAVISPSTNSPAAQFRFSLRRRTTP